jgi:type IV secretory pathway ATPase VirB11/archaellum biosynthesis ATPase
MDANGLKYGTDLNLLKEKISASGKPSMAVVPDTLLNQLLRNNVDYIIRGNLRLNPAQKTNRVINTIYRYIYYMEQKYYGIFSQVSRIGGDDEEPAYLYQIHWERYGLKEP